MRKLISLVLVLTLSFGLIGCTGDQTSEKPEKTSAKQTIDQKDMDGLKPEKSEQTPAKQTIDIKDMDGLHNFVNAEIYQIPREEFDGGFDITFLDVTNDGFEDAVMVNNTYWDTNIEIVTVNGDKYEHLKTDLPKAKYKNEFEMQDGFLKVVQKSGGTGLGVEVMSLLKYDNGRMITVMGGLELSYYESHPPDWNVEHSSQINGPLTDFEYILKCDDNGDKYTLHRRYTYNEKTLSFEEKLVEEQTPQAAEQSQTENIQESQTQKPLLADSGLTKEIIRGNNVDYVKYDLVVIDNYPGGILSSDDYLGYTRPGYSGPSYSARDIAIVGTIYDVYYYSCITGQTYKIADQLSNQIMVVTDEMIENDQSYVSFTDDFGNNLQIYICDADEWYETILVNGNDVQVWGNPENYIQENDNPL